MDEQYSQLIFLDTEFTDFIDFELISIGLVTEDGERDLYLEIKDFDRSKCNAFVQSAVLPQLGRMGDVQVYKTELRERLCEWFAWQPDRVMIASDSLHDRDLVADALEGEWPPNIKGWLDLRAMVDPEAFDLAVSHYHTIDKPWHHALYDALALRAGWLAWNARRR